MTKILAMVGVGLTFMTTVITGSIWAGSIDTRVDKVEARAIIQEMDHDLIIRMNERQEHMLEKLNEMDKKLDQAIDEPTE